MHVREFIESKNMKLEFIMAETLTKVRQTYMIEEPSYEETKNKAIMDQMHMWSGYLQPGRS